MEKKEFLKTMLDNLNKSSEVTRINLSNYFDDSVDRDKLLYFMGFNGFCELSNSYQEIIDRFKNIKGKIRYYAHDSKG